MILIKFLSGAGSIWQLAARTRERRLGIALAPWQAQPYPTGDPNKKKLHIL